jgi:alkylation response protein AidB-like acyl-CoA dehydrogenase
MLARIRRVGLSRSTFRQEYGGLGSGTVETMIIMEEYGRRLVVEPFVETVVLAGGLLRDLGSDQRKHSCRASSTAATSGPGLGRGTGPARSSRHFVAPNAAVMATG